MLTRFHIQKFRLCDDVVIEDLGAVVALVGRNGAGKSNILQALAQTAKAATSNEATGLVGLMRAALPTAVEMDFEIESVSYRYRLAFAPTPSATNPPIPEETLSKWDDGQFSSIVDRRGEVVRVAGRGEALKVGNWSPCIPAVSALLPSTDQAVVAIKPARSFLTGIRYYPLNEPTDVGQEERFVPDAEFARWSSVYESTGNSDDLLMRIIFMHQKRPEDFSALEQLLGSNGLGLVDGIFMRKFAVPTRTPPAPEEQFYHSVRFAPSRGKAAHPLIVGYNALSLGTRRVIRIFVSMLFDKSSVMLIEQPEDSLHQGLTKKMIGLLRQNALPAQLIFSTHSSALLNKLRPEDIQLVSLHNGLTSVRRLSGNEISAVTKFMNEEGTLYDFLDSVQED